MNEEREFSFLNLFRYALRYLIIIVLCVMLGVGVGVYSIVKDKPTNYEKYVGVLQLNLAEYMELTYPEQNLTDGIYTVSARQISQILETASAPVVYARVYQDYGATLYPKIDENEERVETFYESIVVYFGTDSLVVNFYCDIKTEEDRELAKRVVTTYLQYAQENIAANFPQFAQAEYAQTLSTIEAQRDLSLPDNLKASNTKPDISSSLVNVMIYAVIGGVLGCAVIFAMYFLDPRLKSVKDVFNDNDRCDVIDVDEENAITEFLARLKGTNVKRLLLAAPIEDVRLPEFAAKLEAQLKEMGNDAVIVSFSEKDSSWLTHFDNKGEATGYEIYLYNNINENTLFYLDSKVQATSFFVNQSRVKAKLLRSLAQQLNGSRYIGTLLHSKGNVYLD